MANSDFTVKITGDTELRLALAAGGDPKRIDKALQSAAQKAARPIAEEARRRAPVLTGRLRRAIRARSARYDKPGAIATINPGKKRDDTSGAYYRRVVIAGVSSRNIPPRPFMDEAFNRTGEKAVRLFEEEIEKQITQKLVGR